MEYPNATYSTDFNTDIKRAENIQVGESTHDSSHEGIPPALEREHLSELKQVVTEHAREQYMSHGAPQKGTAASIAQSALGKYASAVGTEMDMPGNKVQASTNFSGYPVDEEKLLTELKDEVRARERYETTTQGYIDSKSPAAKVQAAADKLERVVKMDKGLE